MTYLFYLSLVCVAVWVFVWPVMFGEQQYADVLHVGALVTLVLIMVSLVGMIVTRLQARGNDDPTG